MAKKHFLLPSKLINRFPVLRKIVWKLEAGVIKSLAGLIRRMPSESAYRFAGAFFTLLTPILPFTKKIRRNLTIAFPDKNPQEITRLARAICGNLGKAAVDLLLADRIWQQREQCIEFVIKDDTDFGQRKGRPAVMVSGHIGAWQIGAFIAPHFGLEVTSVYAPEQNPYLKAYFVGLRSALPVHLVSRDDCMRHLSRELKQGHMIGLISDTRFNTGAPIDFFGTTMYANTSVARLALRHHCDLIPVLTERLPGMKFRVTAYKPIRPADPDATPQEQAAQMTTDLFRHFEQWIRDDPAQWMCFSQRWPRKP